MRKEEIMKEQPGFFDFAAEVGLTKHIGGMEATEALVRLCHIYPDTYVLDVGCGVGMTPCFLAKSVGCRVMGVDISPRMVERSQERAAREKVTNLVTFKVADAQDLPFEDGTFDAIITESVTAFPEDKQKAVNEYARVTRTGGYVGLNESTWLKVPPPPEMVAWAGQDLGANVKPLTPGEWRGLLEKAGLTGITAETFRIRLQDEERGILKRYGLGGLLGILGRMLSLYTRSPAYRKFVKNAGRGGITPKDLTEYFGYGLFVGIK